MTSIRSVTMKIMQCLSMNSATQQLSERAAGKKRRNVASEAEDEGQEGARSDDEADIPLPEMASTQQRMSRNRKRSRRWDDDFVHY